MDNVTRVVRLLTFSETQALAALLAALNGESSGILITSAIGDKMGVSRGVIVNGLRILEAANLMRTRSLGMKGTFVEVFEPSLLSVIQHTVQS